MATKKLQLQRQRSAELEGELARARDRADALEKELEIARRALDQKDGKVNDSA